MHTCQPVHGLIKQKKEETKSSLINKWWFRPELNWRHTDFQSVALPTELQNQTMVARVGFEPTASRLWAWRATGLLHLAMWMAQKLGFEPRRRLHDLPVFKTGPFSHLGTSAFLEKINGGPWRTRTFDHPVMSRKLWPTELRVHRRFRMVARVRLELTTFRVWTERSSQLSYLARF